MNKVTHFEVPYDDKERAIKFYKEVFGWEMQDMPEMDYTITHTVAVDDNFMPKESGAINGGFYKRGESVSKSPVLVIDVPNIDEHLKKIEAAGGQVTMAKIKVGDIGLYAQVKDPEDNIVGVWEALKK